MSLIPSESYSFPDHFTTTVTPLRKPKAEKVEARIEKPRAKPKIVALPDPPPPAVIEPDEPDGATVVDVTSEAPIFEVAPPKVEEPAPVVPVRLKPAPLNPALRRTIAPPPRIPEAPPRKMAMPILKPKVRWNNRAVPAEPPAAPMNGNGVHEEVGDIAPAQNVIPIKPLKVQPRPVAPTPEPRSLQPAPPRPPIPVPQMRSAREPAPPPQPAQRPVPKPPPVVQMRRPVQPPAAPPKPRPAAPSKPRPPSQSKPRPAPIPTPQADFFEMFAESSQDVAMERRRNMKFRRFLACECAAFAVLLPLVILGFTFNFTAPALRWLMNIFTIAAAVVAAIIPIVFYAFTPTLPDIER